MSYNNTNDPQNHLAPPPQPQMVPPGPRSSFSAGSPNGPFQNTPPQNLVYYGPQTLAYSPQPGFTQPSYSPNAQQQQVYYPPQSSPELMGIHAPRPRTSSQISHHSHHSHHSHQSHQSRRSSSRVKELEEDRRPTLGDTLMGIIAAFKGAFDRRK